MESSATQSHRNYSLVHAKPSVDGQSCNGEQLYYVTLSGQTGLEPLMKQKKQKKKKKGNPNGVSMCISLPCTIKITQEVKKK